MSKSYTADSIQVLDDVSHVRLRPGFYVGGANSTGLNIILKEIIDNSLDEALTGHAETITVILDDDNLGATVIDDGRGIPLEKHPKTKLSTLTTVFAIAKSGAKFDNQSYGTSVGLHGLGSTCSNSLSETFEAWSYRGKQVGHVMFKRGKLIGKDAEIEKNMSGPKHGTRVHFRPDFEQIFKDTPGYDAAQIKSRLEDTALLLPDVKIKFQANSNAPVEVFDNKEGLAGLLDKYIEGNLRFAPLVSIIEFESGLDEDGKPRKAIAEIAVGWRTQDESPVFRSYVNLTHNQDGGVHQSGFEKAISNYFTERARNKCSAKEVLEGLVGIIHLKHPGPQFSSQTKEKLINSGLAKQIQEALEPALKRWARSHAAEVDQWLDNCVERFNRRQEEKDLKGALKDLKITKRNSKGILPAKLYEADCRPEDRELFLCEGDGAGGSAVLARNADYQEILPLKGKILNTLRATPAECLENKEIASIIAAIGGGIGKEFSLTKCRVGKVMLLADSDSDGCLVGETKVRCQDGTARTIEELHQRWEANPKPFLVFSMSSRGEGAVGVAHSVRITKYTNDLVQVLLKNGKTITCTPEHPFLCLEDLGKRHLGRWPDLRYLAAKDLTTRHDLFVGSGITSKIESVIPTQLPKSIPVYDLTVDSYHNFALDAGVFVHNSHISALAITLIATYMRPLLESGRVYVVDSPLFRAAIHNSQTRYYAHTMDELKKKAGKDFSKCSVSRLKGHGEADPAEVAEYALNPSTRKLIQLKFGPEDFRQLELLMSDDVGARKDLLGL